MDSMLCEACEGNMNCSLDLLQWICMKCDYKIALRENSVSTSSRCDFKNLLMVLLAWCNGESAQNTSSYLEIERKFVKEIYHLVATSVTQHFESNIAFWQIGGPDVVVLINVFHEFNRTPILSIASLEKLPPKVWCEAFTGKKQCIQAIKNVINPESIVVVEENSPYCSYMDVQEAGIKFKLLISNEMLSRHDSDLQSLHNNLIVIWSEACRLCNEVQDFDDFTTRQFMLSYMWGKKFKDMAFQELLTQISNIII